MYVVLCAGLCGQLRSVFGRKGRRDCEEGRRAGKEVVSMTLADAMRSAREKGKIGITRDSEDWVDKTLYVSVDDHGDLDLVDTVESGGVGFISPYSLEAQDWVSCD
jgi:hypothetical protein